MAGVDVNLPQLARLLYDESLFDLDKYRTRVFPSWGLDFGKIRASQREATSNVYNFSKHELRPIPTPELTEDFLVATGSLSIWLPPVQIGGDTYIDAIFNTPTNIEEATRRGSDELWVIWTTSQRGEWFDGFVGGFFGVFEATTNYAYKQSLARIVRNSDAIAQGKGGEYGRVITVREIKAEVPGGSGTYTPAICSPLRRSSSKSQSQRTLRPFTRVAVEGSLRSSRQVGWLK